MQRIERHDAIGKALSSHLLAYRDVRFQRYAFRESLFQQAPNSVSIAQPNDEPLRFSACLMAMHDILNFHSETAQPGPPHGMRNSDALKRQTERVCGGSPIPACISHLHHRRQRRASCCTCRLQLLQTETEPTMSIS